MIDPSEKKDCLPIRLRQQRLIDVQLELLGGQ